MFGFTSEELLGKNINMLLSETTLQTGIDRGIGIIQECFNLDKTTTSGSGIEVLAKHKSNRNFPMRLTVAELPINDASKRRYITIFQDLTII